MGFEYDLSRIKQLGQIHEDGDMKSISSAVYPGFHCPLYAATVVAGRIEDLAVLVVGTPECGFYAKCLSVRTNPKRKGFFSLVLDQHDITFGWADQLKDAVEKIREIHSFNTLLVLTTCVTELTGEDVGAFLDNVSTDFGFKILWVRTDHFTRDTPISGLQDTFSALVHIMEKQPPKSRTVNVLGQITDGFEQSEPAKILGRRHVDIHIQIPANCKIRDIMSAPAADLNIVTHFSALDLAEKMKSNFGTDYVYFPKTMNPEIIRNAYQALEKTLGVSVSPFADKACGQVLEAREELKRRVAGKTFVLASPPMLAFDISAFLCQAGMKPLWLQAVSIFDTDRKWMKDILEKGYDPKVSKALNPGPMDFVCQKLQPDFYFAFHPPQRELAPNCRTISLAEQSRETGFEMPLKIMRTITRGL